MPTSSYRVSKKWIDKYSHCEEALWADVAIRFLPQDGKGGRKPPPYGCRRPSQSPSATALPEGEPRGGRIATAPTALRNDRFFDRLKKRWALGGLT